MTKENTMDDQSEADEGFRDMCALVALHALITEPASGSTTLAHHIGEIEPGDAYKPGLRIARAAYRLADAMIEARKQ